MISLVFNLLPYILLLVFVVYAFKKSPIYLLGIPFLMFQRYSIFFENVKIFAMPGRLATDILFTIWLIIFWIIIRVMISSQSYTGNKSSGTKNKINSLDYIVLVLMIISIADLLIVYIESNFLKNVIGEFIILFSLFIGYFIIKDIIRHFSLTSLSDFLFSIVLVNSLASCLYIAHQGLHIPIYTLNPLDEYMTEIFQGVVITRTFWFMPLLCFFSIAYLFIFKRSKYIVFWILLFINLLALFISYTRSFVVIAVFIIVLYFVLIAYKEKNIITGIKNIILVSVLGIILFIVISKLFPASANYFIDRFSELAKDPQSENSNSLLYRFSNTGEIIGLIGGNKALLGYGPVTEIQVSWVQYMRVATYDMVWTGVIFRWGFIGLVLFVLLYSVSIVKSLFLFKKSDEILSQLALFFLLFIVSQAVESFVSSTFLSANRYTMGLWYFGMLSALLDKKN